MTAQHKGHPDYSEGYFDAIGGHSQAKATPEYVEGWNSGESARRLLSSNGFTRTGPATFSKTVTSPPSGGEG